jgi:hypothetical protein
VRPVPKGLSREDLVSSEYLGRCGKVVNLRFGNGKGITGNCMYVDFSTSQAATAAVAAIPAKNFFGIPDKFTAELTLPTKAIIAQGREVQQAKPKVAVEGVGFEWKSMRELGNYVEQDGLLVYTL